MITKDQCYYIGKLTKLHGTEGMLIIRNKSEIPEKIRSINWVFAEIEKGLVPYKIDHVFMNDKNTATITFEDITDRNGANELCGCNLYCLKQNREHNNGQQKITNYKGYKVIDKVYGILGTVDDHYDVPENPLLKISHQKGEVLIPLKESFIKKIDEKQKVIKTTVPAEIININLKETNK